MIFLPELVFWNTNPVLFELGPFAVRWYSLLFASGFLIGYKIFEYIFKNEHKPAEDLDTLLMFMFLGTVLGARLGHCLFYDFDYYFRQHPEEIFMVWKGGLASHGGVIGILIALFLYSRKRAGQSYIWVLDRIAIVGILTGVLIRTGNFFNSEIVGIKTDGSWGVVFQRLWNSDIGGYENFPRVPVQLFEAAAYFAIFALLGFIYLKTKGKFKDGLLISLLFLLVFIARFVLEFWKVGEKIITIGEVGFNRGQVLSIPFIITGLILLIYTQYIKPSRN